MYAYVGRQEVVGPCIWMEMSAEPERLVGPYRPSDFSAQMSRPYSPSARRRHGRRPLLLLLSSTKASPPTPFSSPPTDSSTASSRGHANPPGARGEGGIGSDHHFWSDTTIQSLCFEIFFCLI